MTTDLRATHLKPVVYILGIVGMVFGVVSSRGEVEWVSPLASAGAALLWGVSLACAARAWCSLVDAEPQWRGEIVGAVYASQLVKYLPIGGGVLQAASQITGSAVGGDSRRLTGLYAVQAGGTVMATSVVAFPLVVDADVRWPVRLVAGLLPLALAGANQKVLDAAFAAVTRVAPKLRIAETAPPASLVRRSVIWSIANIACAGLSFAVVLHAMEPGSGIAAPTMAFALAWTVGFLAVPFPGGLGVREAVLVAAIPSASVKLIVAASLTQRAAGLIAELGLVAVNRLTERRRSRQRDLRARVDGA